MLQCARTAFADRLDGFAIGTTAGRNRVANAIDPRNRAELFRYRAGRCIPERSTAGAIPPRHDRSPGRWHIRAAAKGQATGRPIERVVAIA